LKAGENKAYGKHDREQSIAIAGIVLAYIYIHFNRRAATQNERRARWGYCKVISASRVDTANVSGRQSADETATCAIRNTPVDIFFFITTGNQADNVPNTDDPPKKGERKNR
jgi:hypothetical protein